MHLLSKLMKGKYVALKRIASWRQERVAEIEKISTSYTCCLVDYLKKKKTGQSLFWHFLLCPQKP